MGGPGTPLDGGYGDEPGFGENVESRRSESIPRRREDRLEESSAVLLEQFSASEDLRALLTRFSTVVELERSCILAVVDVGIAVLVDRDGDSTSFGAIGEQPGRSPVQIGWNHLQVNRHTVPLQGVPDSREPGGEGPHVVDADDFARQREPGWATERLP